MSTAFTTAGGKLHAGLNTASRSPTIIPSPPSESSSDTLHEDESFYDDRKHFNISPLSTTTLNFEDLKIHDVEASRQYKAINRFSTPHYNAVKYHRSPAPAHVQPTQHLHRNRYHYSLGHGLARGSNAPRNARPGMSGEARAAQDFLVVRNSMKRQFRNSEVAKWKVGDYIAHREAIMASAAKRSAEQAQSNGNGMALQIQPMSPAQQDMMARCGLNGNFNRIGNYGRALGERTIWCDDWQNGKDEIAPWPCLAELKWEGDDRAKTGVGRYPPLPREQGPVGLPWNQLQAVEQYPIDQIARIPTMEDVYLPVDEIDDEVKYALLNKDLEVAMDAYLES